LSLENPLTLGLEEYAKKYGIPFDNIKNANFIETAYIKDRAGYITREVPIAPGALPGSGGRIEAVIEKGGMIGNVIIPLKRQFICMDITQLYNTIAEKLNQSGHQDVSINLKNILAAAATGGEALSSTNKYLSGLKWSNKQAYRVIEDLVDEYTNYCKQNGILIN
jgi:hypothetical protein